MFGYIKPFKPEMKMKEYDTYKAIYCGLCKDMGREYGQWSRFTLSYDFTLVALLSLSMGAKKCEFRAETCIANPFKKKACMRACADLGYAAAVAIEMIYYKLEDNYIDGNFWDKIKVIAFLPFVKSARKKAMKKYDFLDKILSDCMKEQAVIEKENTQSIDKSANPSATALALICEHLSEDDMQKRVLNRLGYLLGRYVYLIDALDDIEDDKKSGNFNVFLQAQSNILMFNNSRILEKSETKTEYVDDTQTQMQLQIQMSQQDKIAQVKEYAKEVINHTVGEIASTYELLDIKRYKTILDNIFYLGLHDSLDKVIKGVKIEKEK